MREQKKRLSAVEIFGGYGIAFVLIFLIALFSFLNNNFLSNTNILNLFRQNSIQGIIAVGMTMVLISGGIDLSVGSVAGLASVCCALLLKMQTGAGEYLLPWWLCCLIVLVGGFVIGMFNGFLINQLSLPPFIATLGTMTSVRGVCYLMTQAKPVTGFNPGALFLGKGELLSIPVPFIIMVLCFVVGILLMSKTRWGTYIYGVGGNEEATRLSGISSKKIKYIVYSVNGVLSALAGIILMARVSGGQPKGGSGYEMAIITSVVLGGVSIAGGEGKMAFVIIGVFIMGVLSNGLIMINVSDYAQQVVSGLVLIGAVALNKLMQKQKAKKIRE